MNLNARSTLVDVAMTVGDALRRTGIRAVLSGGACASLHSGGAYQSLDADFVIEGHCTEDLLDAAMASIGFRRERDFYVHPRTRFFVEFPAGPLGIGQDYGIRPVWKLGRSARMLTLSATDSCRDRLAAFYHWRDRQALAAAVAIALEHRVGIARIRAWSAAEGALKEFEVFQAELRRARAGRRQRAKRG